MTTLSIEIVFIFVIEFLEYKIFGDFDLRLKILSMNGMSLCVSEGNNRWKMNDNQFMCGKAQLTVSNSGMEKTLQGVVNKMNAQNEICGRGCIIILQLQYWWKTSQWIWFDLISDWIGWCGYCLFYFYVSRRWDEKVLCLKIRGHLFRVQSFWRKKCLRVWVNDWHFCILRNDRYKAFPKW